MFDSFERVDVKKNREKEGTGLGLAISRDLVQRMGGDISLHSVYGEGSTFFFTIRQGVEDWTPIREAEPVREKRKKKENKEWMFEAPEAKVQEEREKLEKYEQMMKQVEERLSQMK